MKTEHGRFQLYNQRVIFIQTADGEHVFKQV